MTPERRITIDDVLEGGRDFSADELEQATRNSLEDFKRQREVSMAYLRRQIVTGNIRAVEKPSEQGPEEEIWIDDDDIVMITAKGERPFRKFLALDAQSHSLKTKEVPPIHAMNAIGMRKVRRDDLVGY